MVWLGSCCRVMLQLLLLQGWNLRSQTQTGLWHPETHMDQWLQKLSFPWRSEEEDRKSAGRRCQLAAGGTEGSHLDLQRSTEGHLEGPLNVFGENPLEGLFEK